MIEQDVSTVPKDDSPPASLDYPAGKFAWRRILLENSTDRVAFGFVGENFTSDGAAAVTAGRLNLTMSAYAGLGFGVWLPHLSHSQSTNQLDLQLDGLETNSGFNRSRFLLEFYLVGDCGDECRGDPVRQVTKTMDDEHTPGIFETQELLIPGLNSTLSSYLQWRPVVYKTPERDLEHMTVVNVSSVERLGAAEASGALNGSELYALYGSEGLAAGTAVWRVTIALGPAVAAKEVDAYQSTKFQAW